MGVFSLPSRLRICGRTIIWAVNLHRDLSSVAHVPSALFRRELYMSSRGFLTDTSSFPIKPPWVEQGGLEPEVILPLLLRRLGEFLPSGTRKFSPGEEATILSK